MAASAMSRGSPLRRNGIERDASSMSSCPARGVLIVPGATRLTRMRSGPHSRAMGRLNDSSPALAAP